jgi:hypothetical protein
MDPLNFLDRVFTIHEIRFLGGVIDEGSPSG